MPIETARETVLREIARKLEPSHIPIVGTTSGGGSTTTIVDDKLGLGSGVDTGFFNGWWCRLDNGALTGVTRRITLFDGSNGTITVGSTFGGTPPGSSDYSLWRLIHPQIAEDFLDDVMRAGRYKTTYAVTQLNERNFAEGDGNMDADDDGAVWESTGINVDAASVTKVTDPHYVYFGRYAVRIEDDGVGAVQQRTVDINVVENEQYLISAYVRIGDTASAGTVTMTLLNVTDGSNQLGSDEATTDELGWQELFLPVQTIPADCEQIKIQFQGTDLNDDFILDHVIIWRVTNQRIDLPPWLVDPSDVIDVGWYSQGRNGPGTNAYLVGERPWHSIPDWKVDVEESIGLAHTVEDDRIGAFQLVLPDDYRPTRSLYLKLGRPFTPFTADGEFTTMDRNLLVSATCWEIFNDLMNKTPDSELKLHYQGQRNEYARMSAASMRVKRGRRDSFKINRPKHVRR